MVGKFKVGDKVRSVEQGKIIWTVERIISSGVYRIGTSEDSVDMVPEHHLEKVKDNDH